MGTITLRLPDDTHIATLGDKDRQILTQYVDPKERIICL